MIGAVTCGFIVVMAHVWTGTVDGQAWESVRASKITVYLASVQTLVPASVAQAVKIVMCVCYGLFAFTTLLGMISFAEISAVIIATTRNGSERVFAGCYTLRKSNVQDRGWKIYRGEISLVPSSGRMSRMLGQGCRNSH